MRINTNISAMNTYSRLTGANAQKSGSLAKLSSGLRINTAGDDAAGLTISEKMKNQISGMTQAMRNAQDGVSLIQTAEGALSETHNMLNRIRDLAVQAGNDTNTEEDRGAIQKEINNLIDEIDNIADKTEFNGQKLLNNEKLSFNLQVGANKNDVMPVAISDMSGAKLTSLKPGEAEAEGGVETAGITKDSININPEAPANTADSVKSAIENIDGAIAKVSAERSNLGAMQNRLEHTISNLSTTKENLAEANSRIRDVDMAEEMMEFTKANILSQASTAMLAQANQMPQGVLQLLQ